MDGISLPVEKSGGGRMTKCLNRVSALIDDGMLSSTVTNNLRKISVETLKQAHVRQESGRVIGKNVLDGFES